MKGEAVTALSASYSPGRRIPRSADCEKLGRRAGEQSKNISAEGLEGLSLAELQTPLQRADPLPGSQTAIRPIFFRVPGSRIHHESQGLQGSDLYQDVEGHLDDYLYDCIA